MTLSFVGVSHDGPNKIAVAEFTGSEWQSGVRIWLKAEGLDYLPKLEREANIRAGVKSALLEAVAILDAQP